MTSNDDFATTVILISKARKGGRGALDDLFARYIPRLRRIAALRLGKSVSDLGAVDDLVQEALLRAFQGFEGFRGRSRGELTNWLARCVETALVDAERKRRAKKRGEGQEMVFADGGDDVRISIFEGSEPTASAVLGGKELEGRIESALLTLEPRYREVIVLHKLCGLSHAELSAELGVSEVNARQICFKALTKLRELLAD